MRIGVLGGGQLGRMIALAGIPRGHTFRFLDPNPEACAGEVGELVAGPFEPGDHLDRFAAGLDVVTYEFENVPTVLVELLLARGLDVRPGVDSLKFAQDRLLERGLFADLGIETPRFKQIDSVKDLAAGIAEIGSDAILKTRRDGYDGKGQVRISADTDPASAYAEIKDAPAILDERVSFDRELSIVASRGIDGTIAFYPLAQNRHHKGILRTTIAPAPDVSMDVKRSAEDAAAALLERLNHVGTIALEFFDVGGKLLANEFAPRVHNTGHWTIEGAYPSQFENHVRCVAGEKPVMSRVHGAFAMVNIVGEHPKPGAFDTIPDAALHLYGKTERAGRKLGHVTVHGMTASRLEDLMERVEAQSPIVLG
ncbi:MAG: 5-(carboxyamino)imidazole ribonucleotide synthase [Planctomycetota bacterium]